MPSTSQTCMYIGSPLSLLIFPVSERMLHYWKLGLFAAAAAGILWTLLWFYFGYSSTATDSRNELISPQPSSRATQSQIEHVLPDTPWRSIFKSPPFLSLVTMYCATDWSHFIILNETISPYLIHVVHLSKGLSFTSIVVEVVAATTSVGGGVFSDWLTNHQVMSMTATRKLYNFLGVVVQVVLVTLIPAMGCNQYLLAALFVLIFYFKGLSESSLHSNPIDLSPRHAGTLMGIMNTASILSSIVSRQLLPAIVTDASNVAQWGTMFCISMVLTMVLFLPFLVYGSAERQLWG